MPLDRRDTNAGAWSSRAPHQPGPQRPASRRPTVMVTASSLAGLHFLVLLGLMVQLSTLLLVSAGPVPPRLPSISTDNIFCPDAGTDAGEVAPFIPLLDR